MSKETPPDLELTLYDAEKIWANKLSEEVSKIPAEVFQMTERELERNFRPTTVDFRIRKQFWAVTEQYQNDTTSKLPLSKAFDGICTRAHFYGRIVKNPYKLAWILTPMVGYNELIEEGFFLSLKKLTDEVLAMPVTEKTAPVMLKAFELFASYHIGPPIQRIESKNLNVELKSHQDNGHMDIEVSNRFEQIKEAISTRVVSEKEINEISD